jgi:hypothetical protein
MRCERRHQIATRADAVGGLEPAQVVVHGVAAEEELRPDLAVAQSLARQQGDRQLVSGQRRDRGLRHRELGTECCQLLLAAQHRGVCAQSLQGGSARLSSASAAARCPASADAPSLTFIPGWSGRRSQLHLELEVEGDGDTVEGGERCSDAAGLEAGDGRLAGAHSRREVAL